MKFRTLTTILIFFSSSCFPENKAGDQLNKYSTNTWLQQMFPAPNNCTPINGVYYDEFQSTSVDKIMENKGYSPYSIDDQLAKYKIHEPFYGATAIELGIPSNTTSIFTVTVNVNAKTLANKIKETTGIELEISKKGMQAKSGVAYIIHDNAKTSTYACFSFEE